MKTGQVAQALDIDPKTVLNWVDHPVLSKFFSASAHQQEGQLQREFTQDDLLVLNTIRNLRATMSANKPDWFVIAAQLDAGRRDNVLPLAAMTANTGVTDMERFEQAIITKARLDSAMNQIDFLNRQIERLEQDIDKHLERIMEAREDKARLQRELELWEAGRLTRRSE